MESRKKDHINLAFQSQTPKDMLDNRFYYEPMLSAHPTGLKPLSFLGKIINAPIWVSSMTGGTEMAGKINRNLARACKEFGFGMGLGSCRVILNDDKHLADFDMRDIIGDDLPFYANLGICQVEQLIDEGNTAKITELLKRLRADGLIVHVNPIQEWIQPEGDRIKHPPIDTIKRLLDLVHAPVIVKEVGQGMGPDSLFELLHLPLAAIEFAAYGGTNFAEIERLRDASANSQLIEPLSKIGMDAYQMLDLTNSIVSREKDIQCKQLIISGGIKTFLDGYYLVEKSKLPAVYGQASSFLRFAKESYDELQMFVSAQIKGLEMASAYLKIKQ